MLNYSQHVSGTLIREMQWPLLPSDLGTGYGKLPGPYRSMRPGLGHWDERTHNSHRKSVAESTGGPGSKPQS